MLSLIGIQNIAMYALLGAIAYYLQSYEFFLYSTSYIHFFRFAHLYYYRDLSTWEEFKRDAMLLKGVSQLQLFGCYFYASNFPNEIDYISILIACAGYFISVSSYNALGHNGTYYGIELGVIQPFWIEAWPYGNWGPIPSVWHPMYMGQVYAQLGLYKVAAFREKYPLLVPIHIVFFGLVIAQEIWDIHDHKKKSKPHIRKGDEKPAEKSIPFVQKSRKRVSA